MKTVTGIALAAALMLHAGAAAAGRMRQPRLRALEFTPTGTVLFVAGYSVDPSSGVTGECDFKRSHTGSGRGGGYKVYTDYYQGVCAWDLFGNLLSQSFTSTPQAPVPAPPAPVRVSGSRIVYATDVAGDSTGQTAPTSGFVAHSTSDYVWNPVGQLVTDASTPVSFRVSLASTGNLDLRIDGDSVHSDLRQPVRVLADGCAGTTLPVGATCTITFDYDPVDIEASGTTALDAVHVELFSDAGISHPFTQPILVMGIDD